MAHEWKIGDWCDFRDERQLVYFVGDLLIDFVSKDGSTDSVIDDSCELVHLPDCTGWDWTPPKPIVPPEGYRLVTEGNVVEGDRLLANDGNWYECMGIGNSIAKALASGCGAKAYARKIEQPKPIQPPPGYRLLSDGERIDVSDLFLFGMNWETGAQVGVFTYHLHVPHARKIESRYRPFKNAAEFMPHRDKWFKWKNQDRHLMRFGLYSDFVVVPACASVGSSFAEAFEKWTFEDGTPFGVPE